MSETGISKSSLDVLYLAGCALKRQAPEAAVAEGMDQRELYRTARFHMMTAMVCMGLEAGEFWADMPADVRERWQEEKNRAIRKNMLLDAECRQILGFMEEQGIWHMPLKGILLKELYPRYGMRQMADNDILFDAAYAGQLKEYMKKRGYKAESFGKGNHDTYLKPPVYNFELHRQLFGAAHDPAWAGYYADVRKRLIRDEDSAYGYHFSDEDFYVYLMLHAYKHFNGGGTGLRILTDCYVYARQKESLDWDYIAAEVGKLGMGDFERRCRELGSKLFGDPRELYGQTWNPEEEQLLAYFAGSGTYGTTKNRVERQLQALQQEGPITARTRWRYYRSRIFPNLEWMKANAPFCYRHKWSIPFFVAFRAARGAVRRGKQIRREIGIVERTKEK